MRFYPSPPTPAPRLVLLFQTTNLSGSGDYINFECFCADTAQKHSNKNKPAPRMGLDG